MSRLRLAFVLGSLGLFALSVHVLNGTAASAKDKKAGDSSAASDQSSTKSTKTKKKREVKKKKGEAESQDSGGGSSSSGTGNGGGTGSGGFPPGSGGGSGGGSGSSGSSSTSGAGNSTSTPNSPPNQNSSSNKSGSSGTNKGGQGPAAAPPPQQGPNPEIVKKVMDVQNRNHEGLIAQKGIVGTGTGLDEDGNVVLNVYISGADNPQIPAQIENVAVQQVLSGPLHLYQFPVPLRQTRMPRATPIGVTAFDDTDLSSSSCAAGTLGCRLKDNKGRVYALSNNHVFAGENLTMGTDINGNPVTPGVTPIVQPSPGDDLCVIGITTDQIGVLTAFVFVDTSGLPNVVDCAIAQTTKFLVNSSTLLDGYGVPTSTTVQAFLGQKVQKYGRTTGFTKGIVNALNVAFPIAYAKGTANFVKQISVIGDGFPSLGAPGDSGSLIVDLNRNPVGLLFAGGAGLTFGNPIDDVLTSLALELDGTIGFGTGNKLSIDSSPATAIGKDGRSLPNSP
jgi:hypothetical protein